MNNISLILEGGGMRCVYTAGLLDCFLENGIEIRHCYGVSAGAICGMNYIAQQKERTLRTVVDYIHDKEYCSIRSLLKTGNLFGADMLYNRIPNQLDPFDYDTFAASDKLLTVVCSDVASGAATYHTLRDMQTEIAYLQASWQRPCRTAARKALSSLRSTGTIVKSRRKSCYRQWAS